MFSQEYFFNLCIKLKLAIFPLFRLKSVWLLLGDRKELNFLCFAGKDNQPANKEAPTFELERLNETFQNNYY